MLFMIIILSIPIRFNYNISDMLLDNDPIYLSIPIRFNYNKYGMLSLNTFNMLSIPIRFNYNSDFEKETLYNKITFNSNKVQL